MAEFVITFFSIIGGVIALYKFFQSDIVKPSYRKQALLNKIQAGRKLNDEVLGDLKDYADKNNAYQEFFSHVDTFSDVIESLEEQREKIFGSKIESIIKEADTKQITYGEKNFDYMDDQITKYIEMLNAAKAHIDTHLK